MVTGKEYGWLIWQVVTQRDWDSRDRELWMWIWLTDSKECQEELERWEKPSEFVHSKVWRKHGRSLQFKVRNSNKNPSGRKLHKCHNERKNKNRKLWNWGLIQREIVENLLGHIVEQCVIFGRVFPPKKSCYALKSAFFYLPIKHYQIGRAGFLRAFWFFDSSNQSIKSNSIHGYTELSLSFLTFLNYY